MSRVTRAPESPSNFTRISLGSPESDFTAIVDENSSEVDGEDDI